MSLNTINSDGKIYINVVTVNKNSKRNIVIKILASAKTATKL